MNRFHREFADFEYGLRALQWRNVIARTLNSEVTRAVVKDLRLVLEWFEKI
jgi:hypothetical protein